MDRITTIVHFSMPPEHVDEFMVTWNEIKDFMLRQPGALDGAVHRTIDDDSPFQVVNVAHWATAGDLARALAAVGRAFQSRDEDIPSVMKRLQVTVSQNNYVEAVRY